MKILGGILLILLGVVMGLYVGLYLCFVGGIVDVINQVKAVDTSTFAVAIGILKIVFSGLCGWVTAIGFIFPGMLMIKSS